MSYFVTPRSTSESRGTSTSGRTSNTSRCSTTTWSPSFRTTILSPSDPRPFGRSREVPGRRHLHERASRRGGRPGHRRACPAWTMRPRSSWASSVKRYCAQWSRRLLLGRQRRSPSISAPLLPISVVQLSGEYDRIDTGMFWVPVQHDGPRAPLAAGGRSRDARSAEGAARSVASAKRGDSRRVVSPAI